MKVEALLCSCNDMKMKTKPIKRPMGCYNGRRKSSSRKGHSSVPRGGWLGAVRKKLMLKTHNKNIIIIHNNTSITSNDDDIRPSSSVDPPKDLHIPGKTDDLVLKSEVVVVAVAVAVADPDPSPSPSPSPAPAPVIIKERVENYSLSPKHPNDIASSGDQRDTHKPLIPDAVASAVDEKKLTLAHQVVVHVAQQLTDDLVDDKEAMAAITIQTAFRSHLARRAFKALKSLVRLQAVVRGVVVRRQARMALHCMRALLRLGDRVRTRHLLTYQS